MPGFTGDRCQTGAFVKSFQQSRFFVVVFAVLNLRDSLKAGFLSRRSRSQKCRAISSGENQVDGIGK